MLEVSVRSLRASDAAYVASILRATNWFAHMAEETAEQTELRIRHHVALCRIEGGHSGYVAELPSGDVVGYVLVHWLPSLFLPRPEGYLSELFVDEACRGKGIGRRLLDVVIREARDRNASRLSLITNRNRESYERAFYAKAGWVERDGLVCFALTL